MQMLEGFLHPLKLKRKAEDLTKSVKYSIWANCTPNSTIASTPYRLQIESMIFFMFNLVVEEFIHSL